APGLDVLGPRARLFVLLPGLLQLGAQARGPRLGGGQRVLGRAQPLLGGQHRGLTRAQIDELLAKILGAARGRGRDLGGAERLAARRDRGLALDSIGERRLVALLGVELLAAVRGERGTSRELEGFEAADFVAGMIDERGHGDGLRVSAHWVQARRRRGSPGNGAPVFSYSRRIARSSRTWEIGCSASAARKAAAT